MRILIISQELWHDGTNGGNTLSNIFRGMRAEFAQIFCSPGVPSNELCTRYFQMTDVMALKSICKGDPMGRTLQSGDNGEEGQTFSSMHLRGISIYQRLRFDTFYALKELFWRVSSWKSEALRTFVLDFNPDIVFAPCYNSHFMLNLTLYIHSLTNRPVISYISDDFYSFHHWKLSIVYYINRLLIRRKMHRVFSIYSLVYTMTEEQKAECEEAFNAEIKILRKSAECISAPKQGSVSLPIRFMYAGNIYCGRWYALHRLAESLKIINQNGVRMTLDIFTSSKMTKRQKYLLHDGRSVFLHEPVSPRELFKAYAEHDIALHVESLQLKYRNISRLSFSTKIVDCLSSGCAVMAICWEKHAGLLYLQREDAAICVSKKSDLSNVLHGILENPNLIRTYQEKAKSCLLRNHDGASQAEMLRQDFERVHGIDKA